MMKFKRMNTFKLLPMRIVQYLLVVCFMLLPWSATAVNQSKLTGQVFSSTSGKDLVEGLLVKSLMQITEGNTKQAMLTVNELIRTTPNFKLAHLIRGDLLSAQSRALNTFGNPPPSSSGTNSEEVEGLREEARTRINHYFSAGNQNMVPDITFKMDANQKHLILIDTVKSRLYLYKKSNNGLQPVADYYVSIGKNGADKNVEGDQRTPVGLYFSNKKITSPLADLYGDGAYPLNYPNELDTHNNKTGYGIWLHGTPQDTYSRPPRASNGCVVLSNPDLGKLQPVLKNGGVPVIISDTVKWIDSSRVEEKAKELKALNKALEGWRLDWVSQNTNQYLSNYSNNFFYNKGKLPEWTAHKRRVLSSKPNLTVKVSNVSMFSYPTHSHTKGKTPIGDKIIVVNFDQYYQSPSLKNTMRKRQYWKNENNQWKIIYEGAA